MQQDHKKQELVTGIETKQQHMRRWNMKRNQKTSVPILAVIIGLLFSLLQAQATLQLRISTDGGATWPVQVTDGLVGDISTSPDAILYSGNLGASWPVVIISAVKLGTASSPYLLVSPNVTSALNGGTLTIQVSDTGFSAAAGETYTATMGMTAQGPVTYYTYRDDFNAPFGTTTPPLTKLGPSSGVFSSQATTPPIVPGANPYSLTLQLRIEHAGVATTTGGATLAPTTCTGQIGDFVWNDANGNGCQDANEPGIPNVKVDLYSGACGQAGTLVATKYTDSAGQYLFSGLCPGDYFVSFTTPDGFTATKAHQNCALNGTDNSRNQTDSKCGCTTSPCCIPVTLTAANPVNLNVDCGYVTPPKVTCTSVYNAVQGVPITPVTVTAIGGCAGYKFSASGLPNGLTMDEKGTISGTPTVSVYQMNYTVTVTDGCGNQSTVNCVVTVNPPPSANCVIINAVQNVAITPVKMVGSGGCAGTYTFSATGLPTGISMAPDGTISGTPTVNGTFNYTVTVTDSCGNKGTVNCAVTVKPPPPPPLSVTCQEIKAVQGTPITPVKLQATGGCAPFTYTFSATGLPTGLTMAPDGTISGTPAVSGTFPYTVTVTDTCGNSSKATCSVTVSPCSGSVCGTVFLDCNADGKLLGDSGFPGVKVVLKTKAGVVVQTATTDDKGAYCFTGLAAGTYIVSVVVPANYTLTTGKVLSCWKDWYGRTCWLDCNNNQHTKGSDGKHYWTCNDGSQYYRDTDGKNYSKLWTGKWSLCNRDGDNDHVDDSAGKSCWKDSSGVTHWRDDSGRDCWKDSSGCVYRKDSDANVCWKSQDGSRHWVNCAGKHQWKDRSGKRYCDTGADDDTDEEECGTSTGCSTDREICVATCENEAGHNFGLTGTAPAVSLTKKADKTSAKVGEVITYTFTVKDIGNTCFYGGMTVCDAMLGGEIFHKTPVSPGDSFTFTAKYTVKSTDCSSGSYWYWSNTSKDLVNTATAVGHVPNVILDNGQSLKDATDQDSCTVTITK